MKQISTIYLDLDGVCVDFCGGALKAFGLDPALQSKVESWNGIPTVISEAKGEPISNNEVWRTIEGMGSDFWVNLEWYPWGKKLVSLCEQVAPVVLMTTPAPFPASGAGKMEWIFKEFGRKQRYSLSNCKHHMAHRRALLVDDGQHNIDNFHEHHGYTYLWHQQWNNGRSELPMTTSDRLSRFEDFIENGCVNTTFF